MSGCSDSLYSHTGGERTSRAHPPGPLTVSPTRPDSFLPSLVQMAPWTEQSVVMGNAMVTSAFEDGWTVISHLTFLPASSLRALLTEPPVTVRACSCNVV